MGLLDKFLGRHKKHRPIPDIVEDIVEDVEELAIEIVEQVEEGIEHLLGIDCDDNDSYDNP